MWTDPIHAGFVGNVHGGETIQLQVMQVPRCSDLVSERHWESVECEAIRLERFCNWDDNLHRSLLGGVKGTVIQASYLHIK